VKIRRVIFVNDLQTLLFGASRGKELRSKLKFPTKKPWVRRSLLPWQNRMRMNGIECCVGKETAGRVDVPQFTVRGK
jgi:hypothetical protein